MLKLLVEHGKILGLLFLLLALYSWLQVRRDNGDALCEFMLSLTDDLLSLVFHCCLASFTHCNTFIKFYKFIRKPKLHMHLQFIYCSSEETADKLGSRTLTSLFSLNRGGGGTDNVVSLGERETHSDYIITCYA